jgi:hypothetical protein
MRVKRQSDDVLEEAAAASSVPAPMDSGRQKVVDHYRGKIDRGELGRSRSGLTELVRADLNAYHESRGWDTPTEQQVQEIVREIL